MIHLSREYVCCYLEGSWWFSSLWKGGCGEPCGWQSSVQSFPQTGLVASGKSNVLRHTLWSLPDVAVFIGLFVGSRSPHISSPPPAPGPTTLLPRHRALAHTHTHQHQQRQLHAHSFAVRLTSTPCGWPFQHTHHATNIQPPTITDAGGRRAHTPVTL